MYNIFDLNLKKIQYFLSIVDERSISRAAKILYISQPALSKSIKELESQLNLKLFIRNNKKIELTPSGQYLYNQWSEIIEKMCTTMETVHNIEKNKFQQINLGCEYLLSLDYNELWMNFLIDFKKLHPNISVNLSTMNTKELREKFISNSLDIILCTKLEASSLEKYNIHTFCHLPIYVYGRKDHPVLKNKYDIEWKDLKNCDFYSLFPEMNSWYEHLLSYYTQSAGYSPNILGYTDSQINQILKIKTSDSLMVSLGLDFLIKDNLLCSRKLKGNIELVLVYQNNKPIINEFIKFLSNQILRSNK
ncbi:transcriptional regulator [Amedibacillus dolichus CAG:375]|uniref:Transcriptional regulator n=1 Tax=Amedibacillus dolichus CAG:375 TaxID=1263076 RepID=R7GCT7_9FIRM|nr:LysR family transcriptional regulator [Amedibacillus dolichus]CDE23727.1 transcriptional regulator [Amedibacillus dolichus CAG:375]